LVRRSMSDFGSSMPAVYTRAYNCQYVPVCNFAKKARPSRKCLMPQRIYTFKELLKSAVKGDPSMWSDSELNLNALVRLYDRKGYKVTQANLHRLCEGGQRVGEKYVEATHGALGIPKYLLRGEPLSSEMDALLTGLNVELSTLLLAKKLEGLPKEDYYSIARQIDLAIEKDEQLQRALRSQNVTQIDKHRR